MGVTVHTVAHDSALYIKELMAGWLHSYNATSPREVVLELGGGMSKVCYDWIKNGIESGMRNDIGIFAFDSNSRQLGGTLFHEALISGVAFPALDAVAKNSGALRVTFRPAFTEEKNAFPQSNKTTPGPKQHKQLLANKFRLQISGFEQECRGVTMVEAIAVKRNIQLMPVGSQRQPGFEATPSVVEPEELIFHVPESEAQGFLEWHQAFVERRDTLNKDGYLEYLAGNQLLFTVTFRDLIPVTISLGRISPSPSAGLATVKMMYEKLTFKGNATWS